MRLNLQETMDLVIFTEKILNEKFHFLSSENLLLHEQNKVLNQRRALGETFLYYGHVMCTRSWEIILHENNKITYSLILPSLLKKNVHLTQFCESDFLHSAKFHFLDTGGNWTCIRRSKDVQHIFWTSYVPSVYFMC